MNIKIILFATLISSQLTTFPQNASDSLTIKLEELSKNNSIEGFGVAIFTKDSILYKNGFGYANTKNKIPYTTKKVQKIASISKLLLGVAVMKAQEMEIFHLDDDINDYLPFKLVNERFSENKITIRHLSTHTASLKKLPKFDLKALYFPTKIPKISKELPLGLRKIIINKTAKKINTNKDLKLEEFLFNIYDSKGKWYSKNHFEKVKPGEKEIYSNSGASFLALIIEKASGMPYNEFVRKYILSEFEMNNSGFSFEMKSFPQNQKSTLYHSGIEISNDYKLILYPAGGLETSIDDFSVFMKSMAKGYFEGNIVLSQESYSEMMDTQINPNFTHGILWEVYPSTTVGHQGDMVGVMTYAYYNKKENIGYLLFCNTATTKTIYKDTDEIIIILKSYYGKLVQ